MNLPASLFTIRWLIRDTFRQSLANGIFWLMLGMTAVTVLFCLSVSTVDLPLREKDSERLPASERKPLDPDVPQDRIDVIEGKVLLGFGAVQIDWSTYRQDAVRALQMVLLGLIADTGGILMALIWTAGFLPTFLEAGNASVLLAKPVPRWSLLAGKYLGVLVFVAFQTTLFVGGIWLALAVRTGVWDLVCWAALPVLLVHFAVFFSFSTLLAVTTRSTVACVFGSLLFWLVCLAMNLARHHAWTNPALRDLPGSFAFLTDLGYWVLPKPADLGGLLSELLQPIEKASAVTREFEHLLDSATLEKLRAQGAWRPGMALLSSAMAGVVLLGMAAYEFVTQDY